MRSYKELTIEQYQHISEITKANPNDAINLSLNFIYGVNCMDMPIPQYLALVNTNKWLNEPIPKVKIKSRYMLNKRAYKADTNPSAFTTSQFVDITNYANNDGRFVDILSCILVPEGCTYNKGYDMEEAKKDIGTMSVADASALIAFFLTWCRKFMRLAESYLKKENNRLTKKMSEEARAMMESKMEEMFKALESYRTF